MRGVRKEIKPPVRIRENINLAAIEQCPADFINKGRQILDLDQRIDIGKEGLEYSHMATFHGIPCYFNVETEGFTGSNKINCLLIDILILFGRIIPGIGAPSKIIIGAELENDDLYH
jgi:hypothetical protein